MHFGYPRTNTTFKKRNLKKKWVFQGFPHTRLGHSELILRLKISKLLQKMVKEERDCVEMRDNQSKVRPCDWHNGRNAVVLECSVGKTTL